MKRKMKKTPSPRSQYGITAKKPEPDDRPAPMSMHKRRAKRPKGVAI